MMALGFTYLEKANFGNLMKFFTKTVKFSAFASMGSLLQHLAHYRYDTNMFLNSFIQA